MISVWLAASEAEDVEVHQLRRLQDDVGTLVYVENDDIQFSELASTLSMVNRFAAMI
jgi:hypothetical protein